jgi:flagellar basal-body rod modification protein FlgD
MDIATTAKTMGKDEFLQLFTNQLKYQDPMKPMEGTEFSAQLAQFSSLEQLYNMNTKLESMLTYQSSLNNGMALNLIGRNVKTHDGAGGKVTGAEFKDGVTYLKIDNSKTYMLGEITEIY